MEQSQLWSHQDVQGRGIIRFQHCGSGRVPITGCRGYVVMWLLWSVVWFLWSIPLGDVSGMISATCHVTQPQCSSLYSVIMFLCSHIGVRKVPSHSTLLIWKDTFLGTSASTIVNFKSFLICFDSLYTIYRQLVHELYKNENI